MRVKQWISLFLCVIILLPGCAASEEKKTEREIFAMDTIMNLTFYGENGEQAMTAAVSEIQQLEKTLSVTKADSEISKINAAGGKKVTVSKETYDLLSACIQYGNDTDGLFDISIYPLVKLWGFTTEKYHVPDKAQEAASLSEDIANLKIKVDKGVDFLITQLFYDNETFFRFLDEARNAGITVPILPGLMPITSAGQVKNIIGMSGTKIPKELADAIEKYKDNPADLKKAGLDYSKRQMENLLAHGVDGIHLYSMNKVEIAKAIYE